MVFLLMLSSHQVSFLLQNHRVIFPSSVHLVIARYLCISSSIDRLPASHITELYS